MVAAKVSSPTGTSGIVLNDTGEHPPVNVVQSQLVDLQGLQGPVRHMAGDDSASGDLGKVPHPPQ